MPHHRGRTDLQHPTGIPHTTFIHRHRYDFLRHTGAICFVAVVQLKTVAAFPTAVTRLPTARRPMTVHRTVTLRTDHLDTRHQPLLPHAN